MPTLGFLALLYQLTTKHATDTSLSLSVICNLLSLLQLTGLGLSNNLLTGSLPSLWGNLTQVGMPYTLLQLMQS